MATYRPPLARTICLFSGILPALLAAVWLLRVEPYVELVDMSSGQVVWLATTGPADVVTLEYEHSLYRVMQREIYMLNPGGMELREVAFESYDALTYYDHDPVTAHQDADDFWHLPVPAERHVRPVPFRVGYETEHRLSAGALSIRVADHIPSGEVALLRGGSRPHMKNILQIAKGWGQP